MVENQMHEDEISLDEIFRIIIKRFYVVIISLIIVISGAIIYLNHAVNQYQASIVMLVEPIRESSTIGRVLSSDFFNSDNDITTEIRLIKNVTSLNSSVNKLDLSEYKNSQGISYTNPNAIGALINKVSIKNYDETNIVELTVKDENPKFAADFANAIAENFNEMLSEYGKDSKVSQLEFLGTQIPFTEKKLDDANDELFNYKAQTGIDLLLNSASSLVKHITYLQIRRQTLEYQIIKSESLSEEFQDAFNNQLPRFEDYKEDEVIADILKTYEMAFSELILFDMLSNDDHFNMTSHSVVNYNINVSVNERIDELNTQIFESKKDLLGRIKIFTEENEIIYSNNSNNYYNLNGYYFTILDKLCSEVDVINITKNINDFKMNFDRLPIIQKELSKLEGDVDSLESIRKELNSLNEQIILTAAAQNNNVKIVSPAIAPINPVSPNKLLVLLVAILVGLLLGCFICVLLNLNDDTIHSLDDIKKTVGPDIPLLGWTPLISTKKNDSQMILNIALNNSNSYISERYKSITSNILYGKNKENNVFTVTSSTVNEGKSSLVCNIAVCLSLLGYKVLIFDGDLRAPSIGRIFGIDKDELGYINTIEKGLPLDSVIVTPLSNNENLHVLLPGETTLNPSVFYAHTNYQESISYLRDKFDYIFIDSPPLGYASELLGLISYVDSIILCTRMSISNKKDLNSLISQLDDYRGKIGGIIASACALSSVYSYTSYSNYSRYYDYYYQNSGIDEDSNNYLFIKSERKAIKIFKKDIYKRRNRKK